MPFVALRMGDLRFRGWTLNAHQLPADEPEIQISAENLVPNVHQKGVDMRVGLDIASLTLKKQVDVIVLVTGDVGGCEKPRINGEHKIWGLTSGDDVFSQIGRLVAGSSLPAMNTRCVRTLGRVTRRAGAQRRSREEA